MMPARAVPFNFGDIEYKLPGTYTYTVIEKTVDILGVSSSQGRLQHRGSRKG